LGSCLPHDLVRLLWICANISTLPLVNTDCQAAVNLLSRQIVNLLNESTSSNDDETCLLSRVSPNDLSLLFWSLGRLGVSTSSNGVSDKNRASRQELYIALEMPKLSPGQLRALSPSSWSKLLWGVVKMGNATDDAAFLNSILINIDSKLALFTPEELCQSVASLMYLRSAIYTANTAETEPLSVSVNEVLRDIERSESVCEEEREHIKSGEGIECGSTAEARNATTIANLTHSHLHGTEFRTEDLTSRCDHVLTLLANQISDKLLEFSSSQLRQVIQAYVSMAFQVDDLVNATEEEINVRLSVLIEAFTTDTSFQNQVDTASENAMDTMESMLNCMRSESSPQKKSKWGLLDRGQSEGEDASHISTDENDMTELLNKVNQTTNLACTIASRTEKLERAARVDIESAMKCRADGEAYEVGRCQELIVEYRKIQFQSGNKSSRSKAKETIGRRILSKLFQ